MDFIDQFNLDMSTNIQEIQRVAPFLFCLSCSIAFVGCVIYSIIKMIKK